MKFDPLGQKLITGIANTPFDRSSQSSCRLSSSSSGTFLSRSELVEREQQLSHRYNQLSNQYLNLMSRYEALTSRALSSVSRAASRVSGSVTCCFLIIPVVRETANMLELFASEMFEVLYHEKLCKFYLSTLLSSFMEQIDRGTDPIDPPPITLGHQTRQLSRQGTEERRGSSRVSIISEILC